MLSFEGFRLLMEYHSFLYDVDKVYDKWSNLVSVSLRSIIHSYSTKVKNYSSCGLSRFPSPYGVIFILTLYKRLAMKAIEDCFRLLTELYSFLLMADKVLGVMDDKFPSPYGVIFILTSFIEHSSTTY